MKDKPEGAKPDATPPPFSAEALRNAVCMARDDMAKRIEFQTGPRHFGSAALLTSFALRLKVLPPQIHDAGDFKVYGEGWNREEILAQEAADVMGILHLETLTESLVLTLKPNTSLALYNIGKIDTLIHLAGILDVEPNRPRRGREGQG